MFLLMFAAVGGGLATASILSAFGPVVAVLCAPIGGSLCAVLAAAHLSRQAVEFDGQIDLESQTDTMVATLRDLAAQASEPEKHDEESPKQAHVA